LIEAEHYRAALERIAAEAFVSVDENYPMSWRGVAVERIDIARAALAEWDGKNVPDPGTE
jgi:hypothetical protein